MAIYMAFLSFRLNLITLDLKEKKEEAFILFYCNDKQTGAVEAFYFGKRGGGHPLVFFEIAEG